MSKSRKTVTLLLTVTVPKDMTAIQVRREVRCLINHQSNYSSYVEADDIRARKCSSIGRTAARAAKVEG